MEAPVIRPSCGLIMVDWFIMGFSTENRETYRLVEELAKRTGESMTAAVNHSGSRTVGPDS